MTKQSATLSAMPRTETGKGAARQLRRSGKLPAILYGHGDVSQALTVDAHEIDRLLIRVRAATTLIELQVEGEAPKQVLIREIQRHPFRSDLLHVDFFAIRADESITIEVPIHLEGHPEGVEMGGILQQIRHQLEVECLPNEIPEDFRVDVSALEIGDSIHIADIDVRGLEILDDPDLTICTVVPPTIEEVPEEEEELDLEELEALEGEEPVEEGEEGADAEEDDEQED